MKYKEKYNFKNMNEAYQYLVSCECREENKYELIEMNACIKLLIFDNNLLKEVVVYDDYSDFCMHRKSKHTIIN